MNPLEKSLMALSIFMSVYDIASSPAIVRNRHSLTSSASHVPLLASVPFNLTSNRFAQLVDVSFVFFSH